MSAPISQDQRKECGWPASQRCEKNLEFSQKVCECSHEIGGSGGIFFQSLGVIYCNECTGTQPIRKPIK